MTTQNEVIRALRDFAHASVFLGWRKMLTGRRTETNTITMAGAPAGKTWVRAHDASREQTAVWGFVGIPNVTVYVAPGVDGENRIMAIDYAESVQSHGNKVVLAQQPPLDGNLNTVIVAGRNFLPGRVRPYAATGSMLVYVEPFAHHEGYYAGGTIDLTGDIPATAGTCAWVAVALDPATNTLYSYAGSDNYDAPANLDEADAHAITVPDGYIPLAAVVLEEGMAEITSATRIIDLRPHFYMRGGLIRDLDDLANVNTTGKADGDALVWDAGTSEWVPGAGGGASELDDLTDVDLTTSPTDGQGLKYNSGTSKWEPGDFAGGGGGTITGDVLPSTCQGRLTLTTGVPLTTSDVTAASTLYFTPFHGNVVALHDGTSTWAGHAFTERALALGALSANTNYDIFLWDDGGILKLEAVAWTDGTTRATALTTQDGIYVKSGATTHRYLGTIRTTASAGKCEDSEAKRLVWNCYNRKRRKLLYKNTSATSWNYNSSTWRAFNNSTAYRVQVVTGLAESFVEMSAFAFVSQNAAAWDSGIARDSTSTAVHDQHGAQYHNSATLIQQSVPLALLRETCPLGYHYYQAIERVRAGTAQAINDPAGLAGDIEA